MTFEVFELCRILGCFKRLFLLYGPFRSIVTSWSHGKVVDHVLVIKLRKNTLWAKNSNDVEDHSNGPQGMIKRFMDKMCILEFFSAY